MPARSHARAWVMVAVAATLCGCHSTVDSLGYDDERGIVLHPMKGPDTYPNAFGEVLGKSDPDISAKINAAFDQLFHGDASTEAIYVPVSGQPEAYIEDVFHGDIRTEGMGLGMLISVELDKRDEFDRLWTYAKTMRATTGAAKGYFDSSCGTTTSPGVPRCNDPFGHEHILMALLLANQRWGAAGADGGANDYASGAKSLLTVMRHKEDENGGIVDGVTNAFDSATRLVFHEPETDSANETRSSIETPGFYALWAQATGDPFWSRAAASARAFWKQTANPNTGLFPVRSHFDGTPVAGYDTFASEAFRAQVNFAVDQVWSTGDPWEVVEANHLLQFFIGKGLDTYGREYTLDGVTEVDSTRDQTLVVTNGITGLISNVPRRSDFIQAVWDMDVPTGNSRYFIGIFQMMGLLLLSGNCRVTW